ncbi:Cytochrome P450 [Penicillium concentricum]|uniref:Cytochrome P450 n=1 Tax=Penicillium concentricum TaxID=293559 RepID=A0A9W9S4Q2_9EURO|nr:Cytochrome P450 [Penicillium concentricum]KAJ5371991.1 Cytochrome P450 [Penicillium concentricum]
MPRTGSLHNGIIELFRPSEQPIDIDIVAVHGLQGDARRTWTHEASKVCWPSDLIPNYIKNARVLSWGYTANTNSLGGKATSSDRILQHAGTLIEELQNDREFEDATERPIIFVCHSLGGIIVKRALTLSQGRTSAKSARLHMIYTCTYGILFFGTPHNGSSKARQLGTIHKLASFIVPKRVARFETSLVTGIEDDSETIQNLAEDFSPLMSRYHIMFLWEQLRTDMKYTTDYIVDRESAAPILDGTDRCGIAADHRGICKFENVDSPGFKVVIVALKRYCKAAPARIKERLMESANSLSEKRRYEVMELVGESPVSPVPPVSDVSSFSDASSLLDTMNRLRMKRDTKGSS